jgi:biopolymer transport protein TolQ
MVEKVSETSSSLNWFEVLSNSSPIGVLVMILLTILSVLTWGIVIERWMALTQLHAKSEAFLRQFWDAKSLSELHSRTKDMEYSPAREIFRNGYNEMVRVVQMRERRGAHGAVFFDTVKRALNKSRSIEEGYLSRNMSFLAISASACPFIGLFGTVIGIVEAFHDIGVTGSSSLAAVAPGISEALVATAMGLAAAIPAVVFYNVFASRARRHLLLLDGFSSDFMNILERHFSIPKSDLAQSQAEVRQSQCE